MKFYRKTKLNRFIILNNNLYCRHYGKQFMLQNINFTEHNDRKRGWEGGARLGIFKIFICELKAWSKA